MRGPSLEAEPGPWRRRRRQRHQWGAEQSRASPATQAHSPVSRSVQGLADELHVVIQQLFHDVGPHYVEMGQVARCPQ